MGARKAPDVSGQLRRLPYSDKIVNRKFCLAFSLFGFGGGSFGWLFGPFGVFFSFIFNG